MLFFTLIICLRLEAVESKADFSAKYLLQKSRESLKPDDIRRGEYLQTKEFGAPISLELLSDRAFLRFPEMVTITINSQKLQFNALLVPDLRAIESPAVKTGSINEKAEWVAIEPSPGLVIRTVWQGLPLNQIVEKSTGQVLFSIDFMRYPNGLLSKGIVHSKGDNLVGDVFYLWQPDLGISRRGRDLHPDEICNVLFW